MVLDARRHRYWARCVRLGISHTVKVDGVLMRDVFYTDGRRGIVRGYTGELDVVRQRPETFERRGKVKVYIHEVRQ